MFCPNCGKPVEDHAKVCPACGFYIDPEPSSDNYNKTENVQEPIHEAEQGNAANGQGGPDRRMGLIIALIIIIVAVVVVLVLCLTGVIPVGNRNRESAATTETVEESVVEGSVNGEGNNAEVASAQTESASVAPDSSYVGYWNISGSNEEELTITSVSGSSVVFSLWWYNLFLIDNATATVNSDNICTFTYTDGGITIAGNLTFYEGYIAVQITESGMEYIEPGTMVFSEKHLESWSEEEMAEKNSSSSASSDSSSSSSSNQSSNNASSNSGSNTTVYYYVYSGDYVIPYSSSQYLTYSDIQYLTPSELRIARNEIYARHGRLFDDSSLQAYFNSKPWYHGYIAPSDFKQSMLSDVERANVAFIEAYE